MKYKSFIIIFTLLFLNLVNQGIFAYEPRVIQTNGLEFWTESFGNRKNPAILLIMGSGGQGLLWPQKFCEELANKGYYVIRYDNRDTGLSSTIDYNKYPYNLLDLAKDAVAILDDYGIQRANVVGASMGGEIGIIMAAHYPNRVASLTLFMTTTDMRPAFEAFQGKTTETKLSKPKLAILESAKKIIKPINSLQGRVEAFIENSIISAGSKIPADLTLLRQIGLQTALRTRNSEGLKNHFSAVIASYTLHEQAIKNIHVPTIIIHGDEDPVFGVDHAEALNQTIEDSKLIIIPGLGHGLTNSVFYNSIIEGIMKIAK